MRSRGQRTRGQTSPFWRHSRTLAQASVLCVANLRAHNPRVAGSNPAVVTSKGRGKCAFRFSRHEAVARPGERQGVKAPRQLMREMPARSGHLLGVKPDTVRGYTRTGRLPSRYDRDSTWRGWLTTGGAAVEAYRAGQ
jgi:hypothetical protein